MPQLDIVYFPSQILWLLVSFFGLYLIVKYLFVPKIENLLEYRSSEIRNNLEEAAKLSEMAKSLEENYNNKRMEMHNQIATMRLDVIDNLNKIKSHEIAKLHKKISKKEESILTKISEAKEIAIKAMPEYVFEHSSLLIAKLTGHTVDEKQLRKFYNENKC